MEDETPRSAGRGMRQRRPPSALQYQTLGNPTVMQRQLEEARRHRDDIRRPVPKPRSTQSVVPEAVSTPPVPKPRTSKSLSVRVLDEKGKKSSTVVEKEADINKLGVQIEALQKKLQLYEEWQNSGELLEEEVKQQHQVMLELVDKNEELLRKKMELEALQNFKDDQEKDGSQSSSYGPGSEHGETDRTNKWVRENQWNQRPNRDGSTSDGERGQSPPTGNPDSINQLASAITHAINTVNMKDSYSSRLPMDRDLPTFAGKPEDWPLFVSEFERTTCKYRLENSENMLRLRKALKGVALETVHHMLASPDSVREIISTLQQRFGQPKFVLDALSKKAKNCPSPSTNKPETIIEFGIAVQALVTNIQSFRKFAYLNSVDLLDSLVKKLPPDLCSQWFKWVDDENDREENLLSFCEWIGREVKVAYRRSEPVILEEKKGKQSRHLGTAASRGEESKVYCNNCKMGGHHIRECRKFAKLSPAEKMNVVRDKRLCFKCLGTGHRSFDKKCGADEKCQVDGCRGLHHTQLHDVELKSKSGDSSQATQQDGTTSTTSLGNLNQYGCEDLLWYLPVKIKGPLGEKTGYAMIDTGAQLSILDEEVANQLGITGKREKLYIGVFNGKENEQNSMTVNLEISGDYPHAKYHKIVNVRTLNNLSLPAQSYDMNVLREKYPCLRAAPLKSQNAAQPILVIGNDNWRLGYPREKIEASPSAPAAIKTKLGWVLFGSEGKSHVKRKGFFNIYKSEAEEELTNIVKDFICLENLGVKEQPSLRSKEDLKALTLLEETTKRHDARWETGLLWKDPNVSLPESKQMALKRLYAIERKADRDPEFAELYTSRFEDYIKKGYLKKADGIGSERKWYLPHFFAFSENKKPRLVFDAAAKSNGYSFNDFLMKGPDLLRPLPAVLLRFRRHKIAVTGDIKEMFHQVVLKEEDRCSQSLLYRGMDRMQSPDEYKMSVLFFGSACSPCSAIYVKDKNASEFQSKYPEAVKAIHHDTYMDDFLSGGESELEAAKLREQVTTIHEAGGFQIMKWTSSSLGVIESIPEDLRGSGVRNINLKADNPIERTLGMLWDPAQDEFRFELNMTRLSEEVKNQTRRPTKRELASFIMSLFDPLGFLTPLKVKGLVLFQNSWRSGIGWDDEVSATLNNSWIEWLEELHHIDRVAVPRCLSKSRSPESVIEMHAFTDASEEAYAAAVYLRICTGEKVEVIFIAGKGRVAPLKGMTIPRMELQGALIGSRLVKSVTTSFGEDLKIDRTVYWTDSKTVLCWLKSETGRFSQFVSNRVAEILENSKAEDWRWVPSTKNAADDGTRSVKPVYFTSTCRWLRGSEFLQEKEESWPSAQPIAVEDDADLEIKKAIMVTTKPKKRLPLPDVEDYSSWYSLILKTAKWIYGARRVQKVGEKYVTLNDMVKAEFLWIRQVQQENFYEEIQLLEENKPIPKSSRLYGLSPALNAEGIIVLAGRIDKAPHVRESAKNPAILDPRHRYVELLIKWSHERNAHQGQQTVLNEIRKRYWIINGANAVKGVLRKCQECILDKAKPAPPLMGQLPEGRMSSNEPPFTHTGVDLFGPMEVTIGRRREKRWGIIFTCLTTRGVYLDLVPSLSTSDFIDALVRFNARRGPASHLWCDNGTNFRGGERELREARKEWNLTIVRDELLQQGTEFHFQCPAASHMSGAWERLIGIAKKILYKLLKSRSPREYTLITLLTEVENIMNSRPLGVLSPDPKDPECITPNHILKLKCTTGPAVPIDLEGCENSRKMWRVAQKLAEDFWKQWKDVCLPDMIRRKKWHEKQQPIREGDIVIIVDDQAARNMWRKGVVTGTYPGEDGQVRVVDVRVPMVNKEDPSADKEKVKYSVFRRPVVKVCAVGLSVYDSDKTKSYGREECS